MATQTSTPGATPARLDIGYTLDHGPFTGMQKFVVFLAAMAIVLDGFDGQLIGFAHSREHFEQSDREIRQQRFGVGQRLRRRTLRREILLDLECGAGP